jgi:two-component system, LytTR family, response regulator
VSGVQTQMRVLIADDEALARRRLREMLRGEVGVEVVGECANGIETAEAIKSLKPDLVFLDIQMPGSDGVEVASSLQGPTKPLVIFVTAHDQYAIRAFEIDAVDYVLKPFDRARFTLTLERAKAEFTSRRGDLANEEILSLLGKLSSQSQYLDRLLIRNNDREVIIKAEEIEWIEAQGNYIRIHFGKQSALMRETLGNLAAQLDPKRFARIHRSQIVNIDHILELQPWSHRDYRVVLRNGTQLTLSRTYRDQLYQLLGKL